MKASYQPLFAALIPQIVRAIERPSADPLRRVGVGVHHQKWTVRIVPPVDVRVEHVYVPVATAAAVHEQPQALLSRLRQPGPDRVRQVDFLPPRLRFVQRQGDRRRGPLVELLEFKRRLSCAVGGSSPINRVGVFE